MARITRCPNCREQFKKEKDRTYRFVRVHRNALCPYNFEAAAHSFKRLQINIKGILERNGFNL